MHRADLELLAEALETVAAVLRRGAAGRVPTTIAADAPPPMPTAAGPVLLTVQEAADELRVGRSMMYDLVRRGEVPSLTLGRLRRIPRQALVDWAHAQASAGTTA